MSCREKLYRLHVVTCCALVAVCLTIFWLKTDGIKPLLVKDIIINGGINRTSMNDTLYSIQHKLYNKFSLYDILETKCTDAFLAADPRMSKHELLGNIFFEGDTIICMVHLFDGYGNVKTIGGDHLRARLFNDSLKAYTDGKVIDHNNGTYSIQFIALWSGSSKIEIELLFTREIIAAMIRLRSDWQFKDVHAFYDANNITEKKPCHTDDNILKNGNTSLDICNFSYWNNTMPWFCVKPDNKNLSCSDWKVNRRDWFQFARSINECEARLANREQTRIGAFINISILPVTNKSPKASYDQPHCKKIDRRKIWFMDHQTGYFYKGKWILRFCNGTINNVGDCLRDTTLYLWGDSTTRHWYKLLISPYFSLNCTNYDNGTQTLISRLEAYCKQYNLWLVNMMHNIPVSGLRNKKIDMLKFFSKTIIEQMGSLKNTSRHIILLHMYAHLQMESLYYFIANVIALRYSLHDLIGKKGIQIVIKLPHTHRAIGVATWKLRQPDFIGVLYEFIIREAFTGLHDLIIVLNNRDATIAMKNTDLHPGIMIITAMIEQLLGYVCND